MEIKKGIAVSPGVVIGPAVVLEAEEYRIKVKTVPPEQAPQELETLKQGFRDSLAEINSLRDNMSRQLGQDIASIFDFHHGVLSQAKLQEQIANLVTQRN